MTAQEFLQQLRKIDKMIENKLNEKQKWKAIATCTTANMGGERVQSSGSQQKMADAVTRFVEIDAEIDKCIDELINTKKDVIAVIEQLKATEYDLLYKVYVQYLTLQEVAYNYDKSMSWAKENHKKGLKNVQKILDSREIDQKCTKVS